MCSVSVHFAVSKRTTEECCLFYTEGFIINQRGSLYRVSTVISYEICTRLSNNKYKDIVDLLS